MERSFRRAAENHTPAAYAPRVNWFGVPATRTIHGVGDGRYSNKTLLRQRPPGTVYIGRIRKDSALFHPPPVQPATGRKRIYGAKALKVMCHLMFGLVALTATALFARLC